MCQPADAAHAGTVVKLNALKKWGSISPLFIYLIYRLSAIWNYSTSVNSILYSNYTSEL